MTSQESKVGQIGLCPIFMIYVSFSLSWGSEIFDSGFGEGEVEPKQDSRISKPFLNGRGESNLYREAI